MIGYSKAEIFLWNKFYYNKAKVNTCAIHRTITVYIYAHIFRHGVIAYYA